MFCPNCNRPLDTDSIFCTHCGTRVAPTNHNAQGSAPAAPTARKQNKNFLLFGILGAVLVAIILLVSNSGSPRAGYASIEDAAETFIIAVHTNNAEDCVSCWPDFFVRVYCNYRATNVSRNNAVKFSKAYFDYLDEEPNLDCRVTNIEVCEYVPRSNYYTILRMYDLYLTDAEFDSLDDMAKVRVSYITNGSRETTTLYCVSIDNRWYVIP